jgi:Transposase DDE domain group 1
MQSSHAASAVDIVFDDPNLIADGGLVSVVALAEQVGLPELVADLVTITGAANSAGANPAAKVMSLVAGMVAGADSIEDMDRLRHAGNAVVFDQIRAPSTLGTFLRAFTHGHVQQLNAVLRRSLIALAERTPLLPGADQVVFVDLDSTHRQVYGYAKQGAAVGRLKGKKTLHPLLATSLDPDRGAGGGRNADAPGQGRRRARGAPVVGRSPGHGARHRPHRADRGPG